MAVPKHFLDLDQVDPKTLRQILDHGKAMKKARANGGHDKPLAGKTLAMIFEKPSTRTRVSFEVGMRELGGQTIMLGRTDTQLGRGETIAATARVSSRPCSINVSVVWGLGRTLKIASVIRPSVPHEPAKSFTRSRPVTFFITRPPDLINSPSPLMKRMPIKLSRHAPA